MKYRVNLRLIVWIPTSDWDQIGTELSEEDARIDAMHSVMSGLRYLLPHVGIWNEPKDSLGSRILLRSNLKQGLTRTGAVRESSLDK